MATVVYVDASLLTGSNNGSSWANAYKGCEGLTTAFAAVVDGSDTIIYVRGYFDFHAWGQHSGDQYYNVNKAGSAANNTWLRIIGCGSNGLPFASWEDYVRFDSNGDSLGAFFEINTPAGANIHFYGIRLGVSITDGRGFFITTTYSNICIESCYLDGLYDAVSDVSNYGGNKFTFLNCRMSGGGNIIRQDGGISCKMTVLNCYLEPTSGKANEAILVDNEIENNAIFVADSIFVGGIRGIAVSNSNALITLVNNVFYEQTGSAVYLNGEATASLINNIFYSTQTGFVPINLEGGVVLLEDYNATNKASGLIGAHSLHNIPDPFVDKTNHDFRLKPGTSLLNKGLPAISGQFTINKLGCSTIGAWQQKQFFISKSRIANPGRFSIFR